MTVHKVAAFLVVAGLLSGCDGGTSTTGDSSPQSVAKGNEAAQIGTKDSLNNMKGMMKKGKDQKAEPASDAAPGAAK